MHRLTMLLVPILGAGLMWSHGSAQDAAIPENHYLVYKVQESPSVTGPIILRDQFGVSQHTFAVLDKFANPVDKNREGIFDPLYHQTWWLIDDPQVPRTVIVENQFGSQTWTIGNGRYLVLPAAKNTSEPGSPPQDVFNHYKCYDATAPLMDMQVGLVDQFLSTAMFPIVPKFLCNPVEKEIDGQVTKIVNKDTHLACYSMEEVTFVASLLASDQFGAWKLTTNWPELFCVPSLKRIPVQAEESSWGELKSIYR